MELNNCIKFTYCGMKRFIICKLDSHYEDIIKSVQSTFDIPMEYTEAIYITNGKGYVFEKHIFEYFLLLFPQPELTFHIRLDYSKIKSKPTKEMDKIDAVDTTRVQEQRMPLGNSRLNNKRARTFDIPNDSVPSERSEYIATPVRRQNCFLGLIPTSTDTDGNEVTAEQQQTAKRIRLMQNTRKPLLGRTKKPSTMTKRSLRI